MLVKEKEIMNGRSRPRVQCVLAFLQSTTSMVSLCVTCYNLAYNIGKPWMWNDIVVGTCITTTILCDALRQSLDKMFLETYIIQQRSSAVAHDDGRGMPPATLVAPPSQRRARSLGNDDFQDIVIE